MLGVTGSTSWTEVGWDAAWGKKLLFFFFPSKILFPQESSAGLGQVSKEVSSSLVASKAWLDKASADVLKSWSCLKWEVGLGTPRVPSNQHFCYFPVSPIHSGH